jgi:hypothetical protein
MHSRKNGDDGRRHESPLANILEGSLQAHGDVSARQTKRKPDLSRLRKNIQMAMAKRITGELLVMLALIAAIALIVFTLLGRPARGGELMYCMAEPLGSSVYWSYRSNVDGRPDKCWYAGPRMKPRTELRWPIAPDRTSGEAQPEGKGAEDDIRPAFEAVPVPEFEDRWKGLEDK